jgi:hypothetical protein
MLSFTVNVLSKLRGFRRRKSQFTAWSTDYTVALASDPPMIDDFYQHLFFTLKSFFWHHVQLSFSLVPPPLPKKRKKKGNRVSPFKCYKK